MNIDDIIQDYIEDLNEIANLCENEPERDEGFAAESFGIIYTICTQRIKELDKLKMTSPKKEA